MWHFECFSAITNIRPLRGHQLFDVISGVAPPSERANIGSHARLDNTLPSERANVGIGARRIKKMLRFDRSLKVFASCTVPTAMRNNGTAGLKYCTE